MTSNIKTMKEGTMRKGVGRWQAEAGVVGRGKARGGEREVVFDYRLVSLMLPKYSYISLTYWCISVFMPVGCIVCSLY